MKSLSALALIAAASALLACSHVAGAAADGGAAPDADADGDSDADADGDTDTGAEDGFAWHTFYGSAGYDTGRALAADASGNLYAAGFSLQPWDGPDGEPPLCAHSGGYDIFVLKLGPDGDYLWHTFLQAQVDEMDYGGGNLGVAADGSGAVHLAGWSYSSWTGPDGEPPLHAHSGTVDLFVLKLEPDGAYAWHTFYGSALGYDMCDKIAVDGSGDLYLAGSSPYLWDGPGGEPPLHGHEYDPLYAGSPELFVLKLGPDGAYAWHTFYGSAHDDYVGAIAVDGAGNATVAGGSYNSWSGPGDEPPLHAHSSAVDQQLFVLRLGPNGAYAWHTFYEPGGGAVAVDGSGRVTVTGSSGEAWTGPGGQPPRHAYSENTEIFVLRLGADGAYAWHTFYGAGGDIGAHEGLDSGQAVAVDDGGGVYVTGSSSSAWTGPDGEPPLHAFTAGSSESPPDLLILKLEPDGDYAWHTFYGAAEHESGDAIALDGGGGVVVAGGSRSSWNGPDGEPPLHAHSGEGDLFVLKHSL